MWGVLWQFDVASVPPRSRQGVLLLPWIFEGNLIEMHPWTNTCMLLNKPSNTSPNSTALSFRNNLQKKTGWQTHVFAGVLNMLIFRTTACDQKVSLDFNEQTGTTPANSVPSHAKSASELLRTMCDMLNSCG